MEKIQPVLQEKYRMKQGKKPTNVALSPNPRQLKKGVKLDFNAVTGALFFQIFFE